MTVSDWLTVFSFPTGFVFGYFVTKWQLHKHNPQPPEPFECTHNDSLCDKYGCPDDPNWKGDGCK